MNLFDAQVALVTGAGTGIGRAIALALAEQGATLALVGRRPEPLQAVRRELLARDKRANCYPSDITCDTDLHTLVRSLESDGLSIDVLIHSAGVIRLGSTENASLESFDEQFRTNCRGPFALTQLLLPQIRQRQGQVVFLNSSAGVQARGNVGAYAATKHALKALADSLRDEVNRDGVRVLSVYCGRTATPLQQELHDCEGRFYRPERLLQPEDVARIVTAALGLPRTAEVTDIHIRPMQALS